MGRSGSEKNGEADCPLIRFLLFVKRGPIAQLAEHRADNAGVTGAIPVRPTICSLKRTAHHVANSLGL